MTAGACNYTPVRPGTRARALAAGHDARLRHISYCSTHRTRDPENAHRDGRCAHLRLGRAGWSSQSSARERQREISHGATHRTRGPGNEHGVDGCALLGATRKGGVPQARRQPMFQAPVPQGAQGAATIKKSKPPTKTDRFVCVPTKEKGLKRIAATCGAQFAASGTGDHGTGNQAGVGSACDRLCSTSTPPVSRAE